MSFFRRRGRAGYPLTRHSLWPAYVLMRRVKDNARYLEPARQSVLSFCRGRPLTPRLRFVGAIPRDVKLGDPLGGLRDHHAVLKCDFFLQRGQGIITRE